MLNDLNRPGPVAFGPVTDWDHPGPYYVIYISARVPDSPWTPEY